MAVQELEDGVATFSEEVMDIPAFRAENTVYFKASLPIDHLQSGTKRRRIERRANDVREDKEVAAADKEDDGIHFAQENVALSNSYSNPLANLFEAAKFYCQIYDRPFRENKTA